MKPFDLEAAMRGEPIITRDGRPAKFVAYVPEAHISAQVIAIINGQAFTSHYGSDGSFYTSYENCRKNDLFMAPPPMRSINGHEYPEPVRVPLDDGQEYFLVDPYAKLSFTSMTWAGGVSDMRWLIRGLIHLTREAAEAHARAIILACGGEV